MQLKKRVRDKKKKNWSNVGIEQERRNKKQQDRKNKGREKTEGRKNKN